MYAANLLKNTFRESKFFNPTGIVEEILTPPSEKSCDFVEEAATVSRFRRNFEHSADVHIPMIFEDRTTDKDIVMERIEGVRMDDIEG